MAEQEGAGLTSLHKHMKITTKYRGALAEVNLGTSRAALPQPRL